MAKTDEGTEGKSKLQTAPIPARSALMFRIMAGALNRIMTHMTHRGYSFFNNPVNPCLVTRPIRAHISCTAIIMGMVAMAVQRKLRPNMAPAWVYVAMPEGSSSLAPVTMPGPRDCFNLWNPFIVRKLRKIVSATGCFPLQFVF